MRGKQEKDPARGARAAALLVLAPAENRSEREGTHNRGGEESTPGGQAIPRTALSEEQCTPEPMLGCHRQLPAHMGKAQAARSLSSLEEK